MSRPGYRLVVGMTSIAIAFAASGASGTAQASASVSQPAKPSTSGAAANTPFATSDLIGRLERTAQARFKNIYGSIKVSDDRVVVYLTQMQAGAEKQLRAIGAPGQVRFARTAHSRLRLLAVHQKLTRDFRRLAALGIRIVSWFPGINGDGMEHIGVLGLTKAKGKVLDRLLGAGNIVVSDVTRGQVPQATGNRINDSAPWNGGGNITSAGVGCTAGAGVVYHGTQYMITAAHCYAPGASVYNEFPGVSRPNNLMGKVASRDVRVGGDDTALVQMPVSGQTWTGAIGHVASAAVSGVATNPDGDIVYNEGAFSGEVAVTVQNSNLGCISTNEREEECNIVEATSAGVANQGGDSGGPVIRYIGGKLMVTGIVSAGTDPATCQYNTQYSNACYHVLFYTAMDEILATEYPGASLVG